MKTVAKGVPSFVHHLLFVAGALPLWPFALRLSRPLRLWVFAFPFLTLGLPVLMPWNWLLVAPVLAGANIAFALLFPLLHPRSSSPEYVDSPGSQESDGVWSRMRRSFKITLCGLPFGLILVSLEQWLTDALWSGYYPVNASIDSISHEVGAAWILFALVFALTVFYVSSASGAASPLRVLRLLIGTFVAYLIVHQLYLVLVAIPEWQTEIRGIFPPWVLELRETAFQLLVYAGVPTALGSLFLPSHFSQRSHRALGDFAVRLASVAMAFAGLACVTGMPIHYALLLGQQAEKSGRPEQAISCYSQALTWSQSDQLKSYLQFRVGLLYRKTGHLEEARDAFTRVLVRYPQDETLLDDADEFKEKLAAGHATAGRRVVIPGIEARTEYKSAYCVPNSLGLVLSFWGDRTGAKRIGSEITQLDRGSLITDEVHFAESRGFASLVIPLCTRDQIYRLIDAGIPVLAFIPGHVIAVFGYDEALGTLVTYDVSTFDIWDDARWNRFSADWSLTYNTLGIVVPKNLLPKVRTVLGRDVQAHSETYLSHLLSEQAGNDADLRLKYLRRIRNTDPDFDFFPAGWEYRALSGDTTVALRDDSTARDFILKHETDEQAPYAFAVDLLWRDHPQETLDFLKKTGGKNPLSAPEITALAGAELRGGKPAEAAAILLRSVPFENMDPAPAAFLLRRASQEENADEWAGRLGAEVLGRDELHGEEARLAYRVWRGEELESGPVDGALQQIRSYLERWHAYDTTAIGDLRNTLNRKTFQPNETADERIWNKRMRLFEVRRARLEWANGG